MNVQQSDLIDPALVAEVDLARAAAQEEAGDERVGDYVEYQLEDSAAVTHLFEADKPGYRGWRWAVTITSAGPTSDVTVSEVVLLPGPTALVAPEWVPWQQRVQAGDLGVGDLLPTSPDDPRLVPAYVASDDPAVEEVATEAGLGRVRVMSRPARVDAADRWVAGDFGPRSDMARSAPAHCGTCGFYLPLAGSLRAAFGTCGNEFSPADGHVVHVEYGCGAHSEAEVEQVSPVLVADLIYDDAQLDVEPLTVVDEVPVEWAAGEASSVEEVSDGSDVVAAESAGVTAPESGAADSDGEAPVEGASGESDVAAAESESLVESAGSAGDEASAESDVADSGPVEAGTAVGPAGVTAPDGSGAPEVAVPGGEAPLEASGGSDVVAAELAESESSVEAVGPAAVSGDVAASGAVESAGSAGVTAPDGPGAPEVVVSAGEAPVEEASGEAVVSEGPVELAGAAVREPVGSGAAGSGEEAPGEPDVAVSGPVESEAAVESAGLAGVTAPGAPEAVVSAGEAPAEEASGEPVVEAEGSVEEAGPAVREPVGSGIAGSGDEASGESDAAVESAGSAGVTAPGESVAPEAAGSTGDPSADEGEPAVDSAGSESPDSGSGVTASAGVEAPVVASFVVEDAAPAAIEPVVTGETSPGDESASRE